MSSYLNFYLVPKKTRQKHIFEDGQNKIEEIKLSEGKPLFLRSYSRGSEIYQSYNDTLCIEYGGMEDKYTDLTYDKANRVVEEYKDSVLKTEKRLETDYKMLKEGGYSSELWDEIHSFEDYLSEEKNTLSELEWIADFVSEINGDYCDFEKIIINID